MPSVHQEQVIEESERWQAQIRRSVRSAADLGKHLDLTESERGFFTCKRPVDLPLLTSRYYLNLAKNHPDDPIRRQIVPTENEHIAKEHEQDDPLGETENTPVPRLVHSYADRALLLVTDRCAVHCRFCFRRRFTGTGQGLVSVSELDTICGYLRDHQEIKELLLSGGDPLTLDDFALQTMCKTLRRSRKDIVFRLCTRTPVVLPERITQPLLATLRSFFPLWIVTHFNHPAELTASSKKALYLLVAAGLPVLNQSVLLKGINDNAEVLATLFRGLVSEGVKPLYLFQGDLAPGTAHFRTSIYEGNKIMKQLKNTLSSLALPVYAVDIPGGGGKVEITEANCTRTSDGSFSLGKTAGALYPDESEVRLG